MGMKVDMEAAEVAANLVVGYGRARWGGTGLTIEVQHHAGGRFKRPYIRIDCPPQHWLAVAKWLRFEQGVDHCSMITGIHWPEGSDERRWEVVIHLMRMNVIDPPERGDWVEQVVRDASILQEEDVPLEFEVSICLPDTRTPSVPSVQQVWVGADWNEKETWDLVGIDFDGHVGMRRVLLPHDSPVGYHPLQKQHKLRYHDFEEMYDDAQGFQRKPVDAGKIK